MRAKALVQRGRDRHRVALGIDYRIVGGVNRLEQRFRLRMRTGIAVELREDRRTPQLVAGRGAAQRNGLAPGIGVTLVQQLCNRNLGEIRVSKKLGAVEKCALISFGSEMNVLGRPFTLLSQVVSFEDVEALDPVSYTHLT